MYLENELKKFVKTLTILIASVLVLVLLSANEPILTTAAVSVPAGWAQTGRHVYFRSTISVDSNGTSVTQDVQVQHSGLVYESKIDLSEPVTVKFRFNTLPTLYGTTPNNQNGLFITFAENPQMFWFGVQNYFTAIGKCYSIQMSDNGNMIRFDLKKITASGVISNWNDGLGVIEGGKLIQGKDYLLVVSPHPTKGYEITLDGIPVTSEEMGSLDLSELKNAISGGSIPEKLHFSIGINDASKSGASFTITELNGIPVNDQAVSDQEEEALTAYFIKNRGSSQVLASDRVGYNSYAVTDLHRDVIKNEWFIEEADNGYKLKNIFASKYLTATDSGKIIITGEDPEDRFNNNQVWQISDVNGYVKIVNTKTGKALEHSSGTLSLSDYSGKASQEWSIDRVNADYPVPVPRPVDTGEYMAGILACNLWDVNTRPYAWNHIRPYQDRIPFMNFYKEGSKVSVDWEIKALVEGGVSFIMPCWYRDIDNLGKSHIQPLYDHWIEALDEAEYRDYIKYAIMFVNNPSKELYTSFQDEADLLNNLLPYWINNYFKDPNYLKNGNKPVLNIYNSGDFVEKLGGVTKAKATVGKMEQICRDAGFDGLELWGQFCWGDPNTNHADLLTMGFDAVTCYHAPTFGTNLLSSSKMTYTGSEVLAAHIQYMNMQETKSRVPFIPTVSMGLDGTPWGHTADAGYMSRKWRFTPEEFKTATQNAKTLIDLRSGEAAFSDNIIMYDNWNEFGEGHYILPTEQYGFGYLDSIKTVLLSGSEVLPTPYPSDYPTGGGASSSWSSSSAQSPAATSSSSDSEALSETTSGISDPSSSEPDDQASGSTGTSFDSISGSDELSSASSTGSEQEGESTPGRTAGMIALIAAGIAVITAAALFIIRSRSKVLKE